MLYELTASSEIFTANNMPLFILLHPAAKRESGLIDEYLCFHKRAICFFENGLSIQVYGKVSATPFGVRLASHCQVCAQTDDV